jgi:hypothetical protein
MIAGGGGRTSHTRVREAGLACVQDRTRSHSRGRATVCHRGQPIPTIFVNSNEKILYTVLIVSNDPSIFKEDPMVFWSRFATAA